MSFHRLVKPPMSHEVQANLSFVRSFDDRCCCSGLGNLIVSLSDGSLSLLRPGSQGELIVSNKWRAHDHEPWIAAWNYWHSAIFYSGNGCTYTLSSL